MKRGDSIVDNKRLLTPFIVLAIETSCDETAIAILGADISPAAKTLPKNYKILSNQIFSQIDIHKTWGGVVPNIAKREHEKRLVPMLMSALKEAGLYKTGETNIPTELENIFQKESVLGEIFREMMPKISVPKIDAIAVTNGPGLEPALWVGINFARGLSALWQKPLIPINHMEGHIMSSLLERNDVALPILALLISGGHTELVLSKEWLKYEILGATRDDAVGEAFDKVARILNLPYPGGPEISKLAKSGKENRSIALPRPMLKDKNLDFSFSGLKTAVLYLTKQRPDILTNEQLKKDTALEFERAVTEVLLQKTKTAIEKYQPKTLILGGGVTANERIRREFGDMISREFSDISLMIPAEEMSTDNAIMIALAAFVRINKIGVKKFTINPNINADGNLTL